MAAAKNDPIGGELVAAGQTLYALRSIRSVRKQGDGRITITYTNGDAETLAGGAAVAFWTGFQGAYGIKWEPTD